MNYHFAIPKSLSNLYNIENNNNLTKQNDFKQSNNNYNNYNNYHEQNINVSNIKSTSEVFSISNRVISEDEWDNIRLYLDNSSMIKDIKLSGVSIDNKGLVYLGDIVLRNKNIKSATLEWNYLNDYVEEFENFCKLISKSSLQVLNLNNNKLSSIHINGILHLIKSPSLIVLNLKWNNIGNDTAKSIITNIKSAISIQEIMLANNKISNELMSEIEETLLKNKKDKYISNYFIEENTKLSSNSFNKPKNINKTNTNSLIKDNKDNNLNLKDDEYRARYDYQLISNINQEKKLVELELNLKNQKAKYIELKEKSNEALELEKNNAQLYLDEINKLKEDIIKKEFEYSQNINDYEIKISEIILTNENLVIENNNLNNKIDNLIEIHNHKINDINNLNKKEIQTLNDIINSITKENEEIRKEFKDDILTITQSFEANIKITEDINKKLQKDKDNLYNELIFIKKEFSELESNKDTEFKMKESIILEENNRNIEAIVKEFENKFTTLNSILKDYSNKKEYLLKDNTKVKKEMADESTKLNIQIDNYKLQTELSDKKIIELERQISNFINDSNIKDDLIKVKYIFNFYIL